MLNKTQNQLDLGAVWVHYTLWASQETKRKPSDFGLSQRCLSPGTARARTWASLAVRATTSMWRRAFSWTEGKRQETPIFGFYEELSLD